MLQLKLLEKSILIGHITNKHGTCMVQDQNTHLLFALVFSYTVHDVYCMCVCNNIIFPSVNLSILFYLFMFYCFLIIDFLSLYSTKGLLHFIQSML